MSTYVERFAWVAGCVLLATYGVARWQIDRARDEDVRAFAAEGIRKSESLDDGDMAVPVDSAQVEEGETFDVSLTTNTTDWSIGRKAAYEATSAGNPIGVLRIAALDLTVPIYEGDTELNLNRGAAWIDYTAPLGSAGNIGLAGHRDGYFRVLRHAQPGDDIIVETPYGTFHYVISATRVVRPSDVGVLASSQRSMLTLVTCYPFYFVGPAPKRFIVQARLAMEGVATRVAGASLAR